MFKVFKIISLFLIVFVFSGAKIVDKNVLAPFVKESSAKYGVEEELIWTVIAIESSFREDIVYGKLDSIAKARGAMQLIESTANRMGYSNFEDMKNPKYNIDAGTRYLKELSNLPWINGNKGLILAAYNAGPNRDAIKRGEVPYFRKGNETQNYVKKGKEYYEKNFNKEFGEVIYEKGRGENDGKSAGEIYKRGRKGYYPSVEALNYPNVIKANSNNFCSKIQNAPEKSLIILSNGRYRGNECKVFHKHYLTIKGESKEGVVFNSPSSWIFEIRDSSYINFMDYSVDTGNFGKVSHVSNGGFSHHIYFGNITIQNGIGPSGCTFYTNAHARDITLDRVAVLSFRHDTCYGWYAQGVHLTVSNSLFTYFQSPAIVIRGHYPHLNWIEGWRKRYVDVYRGNYQNIDPDDWTHLIVNNTFAFTLFNHTNGGNRGHGVDREAPVSFFTGGPNTKDTKERSVFPPQNVVIENNVFYGVHIRDGQTGAITIQEDEGFPNGGENASDRIQFNGKPLIKGTIIRNNVFENEIFRMDGNSAMITLENNKKNVGKKGVGLVDPEGGNYSPRDDAVLLINKSAVNGNYQPLDILGRRRDQYPDIGAFEGKDNHTFPPPSSLPPTNLRHISNFAKDPPFVVDGSGLVLKPLKPLTPRGAKCIRDCNSEYARAQDYIRQMTEIRYKRIAEEIKKLKQPLKDFADSAERDFNDNKALAHKWMKQRYVQKKYEEYLYRKANDIKTKDIRIDSQNLDIGNIQHEINVIDIFLRKKMKH